MRRSAGRAWQSRLGRDTIRTLALLQTLNDAGTQVWSYLEDKELSLADEMAEVASAGSGGKFTVNNRPETVWGVGLTRRVKLRSRPIMRDGGSPTKLKEPRLACSPPGRSSGSRQGLMRARQLLIWPRTPVFD